MISFAVSRVTSLPPAVFGLLRLAMFVNIYLTQEYQYFSNFFKTNRRLCASVVNDHVFAFINN
jgi:hypothetical protein